MIEYRKMTQDDINAGLALCRSAGWNQLENDWKIFLKLDPDGSRVAVDENNKVVGTVTTISYEDRFSWVGMVLVDPSKKRQGIGTQLLREALDILSRQETVKLDATPAGREVYLKLGFRDEYILSRMMAQQIPLLPPGIATSTSEKDMNQIFQKDREIFGASRKELLMWMHEKNAHLSFVIKDDVGIVSYSFGRSGFNYSQIGAVIADTLHDAVEITKAALKNTAGPVVMDVMDGSDFQQWLLSNGFSEQRKLIRMFRGQNTNRGVPEKQFAILGPEFG